MGADLPQTEHGTWVAHRLSVHVLAHGYTHVGRRPNNEDAFAAIERFGLALIADGMGGYEGGEIASQTVIETIVAFFERMSPPGDLGLDDAREDCALARSRMDLAMRIAHGEIGRRKVGALANMGSTAAAVVVQHGRALIAHVGDSRAYRLRGGRLEPLTRDHSLYAEMQAAGAGLPPPERCSFHHVITRGLGVAGDSRPDIRVESVLPGDLFLLTTDGVTDVVGDEAIAAWARKEEPSVLPERLVQAAWDANSHDNATVVALAVLP